MRFSDRPVDESTSNMLLKALLAVPKSGPLSSATAAEDRHLAAIEPHITTAAVALGGAQDQAPAAGLDLAQGQKVDFALAVGFKPVAL